jgi:hypothetical protein
MATCPFSKASLTGADGVDYMRRDLDVLCPSGLDARLGTLAAVRPEWSFAAFAVIGKKRTKTQKCRATCRRAALRKIQAASSPLRPSSAD